MQKRFIRKPAVREITQLSDSTIRRLELAGEFPRRRKISAGAVAWIEGEVLEWVESRKPEGAPYVA